MAAHKRHKSSLEQEDAARDQLAKAAAVVEQRRDELAQSPSDESLRLKLKAAELRHLNKKKELRGWEQINERARDNAR